MIWTATFDEPTEPVTVVGPSPVEAVAALNAVLGDRHGGLPLELWRSGGRLHVCSGPHVVGRVYPALTVTPGVQHVIKVADAAWLVNSIAYHQAAPRVSSEGFQHWVLEVRADDSAVLTMTDGDDPESIVRQEIEHTDYAEAGERRCELYLVVGEERPPVLMLPCEY